jgi:adenylate cyclase
LRLPRKIESNPVVKRSLVATLIIGALVSAIVIGLHAARISVPLENALVSSLPGSEATNRIVSAKLQYPLVVLLAFGAAWLVLTSARRKRLHWPVAILALELIAVAWICSLYRVSFQPLSSVLALALGFLAATGYAVFQNRSRSGMARDLFGGRLSPEQVADIASGDLAFEAEGKTYEATAVVCDIANKHDLADECAPATLAEITDKFIRHVTGSFLKAGAYIETVNGEGVVAVFGFPKSDQDQAERATKHALALLDSFAKLRASGKDEAWTRFDIHVGISSGTMMFAPVEKEDRRELLSMGEPVELARRFCIANRFYGSRVLIGPRTFELANKSIVARPIDFLSGVDVRERHEIYEPLVLADEASPEQIARRDSFWNGVVLYREKRWAEAYSQFQKARGPNEQDDAPLQLYVRRLEPLALHLVEADD